MAQKKRVSIDFKKIKSSPKYKQIVEMLNKNPIGAYKELTVMSETDNPISEADGGLGFINDLKSQIRVSPEELEQNFQPEELPDQVKKLLDTNPEDTYKRLYNAYKYEPGGGKLKLRSTLAGAKNYLSQKGVNPDDYFTTDNPFIKGLNVFANAISVPSNTLAKIFAKEPDKVKIWGGKGWEETLRQYGMNPEIQSLIDKTQKNIPLTPEEQKTLSAFDTKYGILGFIGNVIADPLIIAGGAGKILAKGTGTVAKLGTGLKAVSSPIRTFKEAKRITELASGPEVLNIARETLSSTKNMLEGIEDAKPLITRIDSMLKEEKINNEVFGNYLEQSAKILKSVGKNKEADDLLKSVGNFRNVLKKAEQYNKSQMFKIANDAYKKAGNVIKNFKEKSGIRKLFISDLPQEVKGIKGSPQAAKDMSRRLKLGAQADVNKAQFEIAKKMKELIPKLAKHPDIEKYVKESGQDLDSTITQIIERPGDWKHISKEFPEVRKVRDAMDEFILTEAKHSGGKIKPLNGDNELWAKTADEYSALAKKNPYHPDVPVLKSKLKKMLDESNNGIRVMDDGTVEEMADNIAYLTHAQSKEAKKIYQTFDGMTRGYFGSAFKSYISNVSKNQRNFKGSIAEINKSINDGSFVESLRESAKSLSGDEAKAMNAVADDFQRFVGTGIKFFDTDIGKLIGIRGARTARTIEQSVFYDNILQFGSDVKEAGWVKPNIDGKEIAGLTNKYYHPDIAQAIEKMWGFTRNEKATKVLINALDDFANFWKSVTLGTHIATPLRNALGNVMNSLLVVDSPKTLLQGVKDAFLALTQKSNYNIVTKSGKMVPLQNILNEAKDRGIFNTTFKNIETQRFERADVPAAGTVGKVIQNVGEGFNKGAEFIKNLPLSSVNNMMEANSKLALFITKVRDGMSYDDAAKEVYKVLFDYSDLTEVERDIRKIVPFFSWIRKNLPLQIGNLLSTPSKFLMKGWYAFNQNRPSNIVEDERMQSDFMQTKTKINIGTDEKGRKQYLYVEGLIPFFDISGAFRLVGQKGLNNFIDDMMGSISPLLKTPVEILANRNFAFKSELRKSKGEMSQFLGMYMAPEVKAMLDDWRVLSTINKGIQPPTSAGIEPKDQTRMWFTWIIGNSAPFNPYYARLIEGRDATKNIQDELTNYKTFLSKINSVISGGKRITRYDSRVIRDRAKNILVMINKAYVDGKIDQKQRGNYTMQLLKNFMPEANFKGGKRALQNN